MNSQKQIKKILLKVFLGIFIVMVLNNQMYALVWANYSEIGFNSTGDDRGNVPIRNDVMRGAASFLKSYSHFLMFLSRIELSELAGLDYEELQPLIDQAVAGMTEVKVIYSNLTHLADETSYNKEVIDQLMNFDYPGFQALEGLNGVIYHEAASFLEKGDIRGIYHRLLSDSEYILALLTRMKEQIDAREFPQIPDLWKANQFCNQSLLFGQYVSQIFQEIK